MEDQTSCRVGCMDETNLFVGVALDYYYSNKADGGR